ncbi:MAG TPA: RNA polymerase sigma factor [Firmicutes bacterium]|nr:RNA polymerase sigma factor [Bacillota bacterium]
MLTLIATMAAQAGASLDPEELEGLLAGLAAGNRDSLAALYHRTRAAVYGLALSYLKNGHDAEDVTQDTFVRAWDKAEQYRPQGKPLGWLLAIARNLALMKLRDRGKSQDLPEDQWENLAIENPMVTLEDRQLLTAAMAVLTDQERQVVILHAVTGLRHKEIAALLEIPLATALSKYHRALKKLKSAMKGEVAQ